jgi:hypothetical protein
MDFRRAVILIVMDVLLLTELTLAIWWAHFEPEAVTLRFMQVFLLPFVLTIVGTRLALWRWAPKVTVSVEEAGRQPWGPVSLFGALESAPPSPRREP